MPSYYIKKKVYKKKYPRVYTKKTLTFKLEKEKKRGKKKKKRGWGGGERGRWVFFHVSPQLEKK